jgi:hypothetical protein
MINSKYIELINKDIDRTITSSEKKKLEDYLEINQEAKELHTDLFRTEKLLDKLPDVDPSENLKKRILNSIDYDRYSSKKKESLFSDFIGNIFSLSLSPRKIVTSLTLVLIIGSIILFSIYLIPSFNKNLNDQNVYGTIGVHKTELLEMLKIDNDKVLGSIQVNKEVGLYKFKIDINSVDEYNLQIEFDPNNISIEKYPSETNVKISEDKSSITFSNSSRLLNEIVFSSKNISEDKFSIKISKDDNNFFQREIVLTKD